MEAQACYSLGNTYTLLRDYTTAIEYHLWHLEIAQQLKDRVGEGRACWSLGNAYAAMGNHEKALHYANLHLNISKELEDSMGQATAQMNVDDLQKILGLEKGQQENNKENIAQKHLNNTGSNINISSPYRYRLRRQSMDNLDLIKVTWKLNIILQCIVPMLNHWLTSERNHFIQLTPDAKLKEQAESQTDKSNNVTPQFAQKEEDNFFDVLSRFQSGRMDDQRCALNTNRKQKLRTITPEVCESEDKYVYIFMENCITFSNDNFS